MGIIEAIKMITLEEGIERGMKKGMTKGIETGVQNTKYEIVKNLILNTDFEISKIAALTNCSESFVEKVKKDLEQKE